MTCKTCGDGDVCKIFEDKIEIGVKEEKKGKLYNYKINCPNCKKISEVEMILPAINFLHTCKCQTKIRVNVVGER